MSSISINFGVDDRIKLGYEEEVYLILHENKQFES